MNFVKPLAVASALAIASTAAIAGGLDPVVETPPLVIPDDTGSSAGSLALGSLGSLGGGATAALVAAVVVAGVVAAGDDDDAGGSGGSAQ